MRGQVAFCSSTSGHCGLDLAPGPCMSLGLDLNPREKEGVKERPSETESLATGPRRDAAGDVSLHELRPTAINFIT